MTDLGKSYGYTKAFSDSRHGELKPLMSKTSRSVNVSKEEKLTAETLSKILLTPTNKNDMLSKTKFIERGINQVLIIQISGEKLYFCGDPTEDYSNDTKITIPVNLKKVSYAKNYYEMERMISKGITFEQSPKNSNLLNILGKNLRTRGTPVPLCATGESTHAELFLDQLYNEIEKKQYVRYEDADITKCFVIIGKKFSAFGVNARSLIWFTWSTMFVDNLTGLLYVPGGGLVPVKNPMVNAFLNAGVGLLATMLIASPFSTPLVSSVVGYINILNIAKKNTIIRRAIMLKRRGEIERARYASAFSTVWSSMDKWMSSFLVFFVIVIRQYGTPGGYASSVIFMTILSMHGIFNTLDAGSYLANIIPITCAVVLFTLGILLLPYLDKDLFQSFVLAANVNNSEDDSKCQISLTAYMPVASLFCIGFAAVFSFANKLPLPAIFCLIYILVPFILGFTFDLFNVATVVPTASELLPSCFDVIDDEFAYYNVSYRYSDASFTSSFSFLQDKAAMSALDDLYSLNEDTEFTSVLDVYKVNAGWSGVSVLVLLVLLLIIAITGWPRKIKTEEKGLGWIETPNYGAATAHMIIASTDLFIRENDGEEGYTNKFSWVTDTEDKGGKLTPIWLG